MNSLKTILRRIDISALICAFLLAAFSVVSIASDKPEGAGTFLAHSKVYVAAAFIAIFAIAYAAVAFLFRRFDENGSPAQETIARPRAKQWLITFAVIYICWLPWIISHYPGMMRDDSVRQLLQTFSIEPYQSANPLFDTWAFGLFWHLGDALGNRALGLYIFGFAQSALTAASFSCLFCYLTYIKTRKEVVIVGTAAVSLLSFFPLAAMSMSKDGFNGWLFLLFAICFTEGCRTKGEAFRKPAFSATFILLSIATIITKATMLYVVGLSYLVLIGFLAISKSKSTIRALAFQGTSVILALCITSFVLPALMQNDATKNLPEKQASAGATFFLVPLQQVGRVLSDDLPIDESTMQSIESYIDANSAASVYNPNRSDEMSWTIRKDATSEDRIAFLLAWLRLGFQYPSIYASALADQISGWFSPLQKITFGYDLSNDVFDDGHMQLWSKYFDGSASEAYQFLSPLDQETPGTFVRLKNCTEQFATLQYDTPVITSMGLWCSWIPICMAVYCISRKKYAGAIALAPSFATLLSLIAGPMVLYWYGIPMYYVAFLSVGIAASPSFSEGSRLSAVKGHDAIKKCVQDCRRNNSCAACDYSAHA